MHLHETSKAKRRKRALAHQCPTCRRHWALTLVEHPSGKVLLCRYCSTVRQTFPAASLRSVSHG
ncbi:MAG: hypothetical protein ACXVWU_04085 [Nocardioides sp.]